MPDNEQINAWTYRCYTTASGRDAIEEWYEEQDSEVQSDLDTTLELLSSWPRHEWKRPHFDKLHGHICAGFDEVRIRAASGVYRIIGCSGPMRCEFTLLIGFKKTRKADTERACKIARERKREVDDDNSRLTICRFP